LTKLYGLVVVFKISVNPMWIVIISQSTTKISEELEENKMYGDKLVVLVQRK
jgi:hypothetical protein